MEKKRSFLGFLASLFVLFFTVSAFAAGYTCDDKKKYTSCNAGYYLNGKNAGNSCSPCPAAYPNSAAGNSSGITACYSNTKSRAWTGTQVNGATPSNCASVTSWNSCSIAACDYVAYANSAGTGDGTIKSGCSTNNANCTKTPKAVSASSGSYVSGTSCLTCSSFNSSYPKSDGGNISSAYCYKDGTNTGLQVNGATPSNCASVTAWNSCTPGTCTYKDYYSATDSTCTPTNCTRTPKTVTAATNSYVDGASCKTCRSYNATYPKSAGGSISYAYCYREQTKTGQQVNGSTPSGCYSVLEWNSCTPGTCTYKDYHSATDTTCTANNCTKTPKTVTAGSGKYVSGATCPVCDTSYPLSPQGNSYAASQCYRNCTTADVDGSATVTGTVTKGGTSTCKANTCDANHCKTTVGTCITKPANGQCNTSGGDPITCNPGYHLNTAKTDCIANTYPVTYSCGGNFGTPPAKNTATYNASYTPRNNSCTRANYVFAGWQVSGTTDIKAAGANFQWKYTEAKTFTAKWTATACPAGKYLNAGNCNDCPVDWPLSQAGANHSRGDCYLTCNSATCIVPDEKQCPSGAYECDFNRDAQVAGREYFDTGECVLRPEYATINSYCPIGTVKCDNGYYKKDATCPSCSSLGNGKWTQSLRANNDSPAGCFAPCTKQCTQKPCPAHSTCTYESEAKSGGIYYPNNSCNVADFYCEMTITPDTGYENCTDSGCDPIVAEISLNPQSGTSTVSKIYQKYSVGYSLTNFGATVTKIAIPTRATYSFNGYFTAATGGEKIVDSNGNIIAANTKFTNKQGNTIYAQWTRLTRNCVAGKAYNGTTDVDCPAGKYCPGTGTAIIGTAGCATNCPADAAGGSVTSATGSSAIDACKTVRPNTILADKTGRGDQTCGYNTSKSDYSTSCTINVTACNAGYYRQAENSTTCSSTGIGEYSPTDDINKYSCSALTGAGTNVTTATQNSGSATLCYNPCNNIEITNGTRVPVNTKEFYNGTTIPACTYTTTCEPGYRPQGTNCISNIYAITLNHDGGTSSTNTIYLMYAVGWFSDAAATNRITSVAIPTKGDGLAFSGYVSANKDVIVDASGVLTTDYTLFKANATIKAEWGARTPITCAAGTYYPGSKTVCKGCPTGSYCPGTSTFEEVGSPRGINTCQSLGGTYTHATGAPDTVISSKANSKAASDCYATNVAYTSASNKASGSQTCYFNPTTRTYIDKCEAFTVLSCVGGYYRVNDSDTDCTAVGVGYYSPINQLTKTACPNLDAGVKTFSETSEKVTECYLGNIWYTPTNGHSGHRRSCYHIADASETDVNRGYSYNCEVPVIVTCDGGYYDDGRYVNANNERDCTQVTDKNSYSPAQSFFTTEASQPNQENPGSSTKLHSCPTTKAIANGTAKRVFQSTWTANDYAKCEYKAADCNEGYRPVTSGTTAKCVWADPNACPEGFYCPGGSDEPIQCPNDKAGNEGSSELGSQNIEDCFITYNPYSEFQHGTGSAVCNYSTDSSDYTRCHDVEVISCDAGYYYGSPGAKTCNPVGSGYYSPANVIERTNCPAGGSGSLPFADSYSDCYKNCQISVPHSESVGAKEAQVFWNSESGYAACSFSVTCLPGYTVKGNNGENPTCDANTYTVTLDKNGGTGNVAASVECTFNSGACALPATTGLTRAGYSVGTKWCTDINGGGTCYNGGTTVTSNISANGTAMTLYAVWTPNVYTITLKHADANVAGAPATAYLKYATGWFADSGAILPLSTMSTLPAKTGYEFAGYASANKTPIVSTEGRFLTTPEALTFTTTNTEINVVWSAGNTICPAGQYYVGTGSNCAPCSDNHYCPGGKYATEAGKAGENACRDGGKTAPGSAASSESECFKEDLPTYVASYGSGTQKCYFNTDNLVYSENCTDKFITSCISGYWQSNMSPVQTAPDCEPVGTGYFSPDESTDREACPNGGTTSETDAASVQRCFKTGLDYSAAFGTGTQRCYYTSGTGSTAIYTRECDTKKINKCRGGYWLDTAITNIDCSPVGYNYYSETDDIERHACEGGGKTNSDTTSSPLTCYKDSETYTAAHGGGFRTCYYTSGTGDNALYETSCETPTLTYCNGGYYANVTQNRTDCVEVGYGFWSPIPTPSHLAESLDRYTCGVGETTETSTSSSADECFICSGGQICPGDGSKPKTCSELTNGTHPNSDEGNTEVAGCWRDCEIADNAATMKGHDYYGKPSTCQIDHCKAGFDYNPTTKACEPCQAGMFCGGGDGDGSDNCPEGENCEGKKSCSELGDGSWTLSDIGAMGPKDCYKKCEQYDLEGGIAIPLEERAYYAQQCQFKGFDPDGNPCDIESGTCITTSCKPSFEMVNGKCVACNRDHALSYKNTGNCMVETCEPGWHPYGQNCEGDITECDAPNALRAEKQWDYKKNAYGICLIKECEDGFHISSNACVRDIQECTVEHGTGVKEWNHTTGTWGECVATYCDPGWTNDPYETNEPTKQCGHCKNKFGVKGELAASSYSRGCTISACMYQGEMYNLENNECNPICDVNGYEDETGTMKWNPATKKCERTCKEGYVMW